MNIASKAKEILECSHYAVETRGQHYYQLYPKRTIKLVRKTGETLLMIIPIGDSDADGDYWVIPFTELKDLLVPENLTYGISRDGVQRSSRWLFHVKDGGRFVLYPGDRKPLEIDVHRYHGVQLPLPLDWEKLLLDNFI
jgi:hypothetical protein